MRRIIWSVSLIVAIVALTLGLGQATRADEAPPTPQSGVNTNLLVNGGFEDLPFYWRYPNHFVGGGWIRWWIHLSDLPEYADSDGSYGRYPHSGAHGQVYFVWGKVWTAGIYQMVDGVIPCAPYELTVWARNEWSAAPTSLPHARIGLDPQGTQLTLSDDDCAVHNGLPPLTVWSAEQTAGFTWEQLAVQAEPLGNRLTVILYSAPWPPGDHHVGYYFDSFWDDADLHLLPPPWARLPNPLSTLPDGFASEVAITPLTETLTVEWETPQPVFSQLWYRVVTPTAITTPTAEMTHTLYMPAIAGALDLAELTEYTPLASSPATSHQAVIAGLQPGQVVQFAIVTRHLVGGGCGVTVSEVFQYIVLPSEGFSNRPGVGSPPL